MNTHHMQLSKNVRVEYYFKKETEFLMIEKALKLNITVIESNEHKTPLPLWEKASSRIDNYIKSNSVYIMFHFNKDSVFNHEYQDLVQLIDFKFLGKRGN